MIESNKNNNSKVKYGIYPVLYALIVLVFGCINAYKSALFGNFHESRTEVYVLLGAIIACEIPYVSCIVLLNKCIITINRFACSILCFALWVLAVNAIQDITFWTSLVHVGILILWMMTYLFVVSICKTRENVFNVFYGLLLISFIMYIVLSFFAKKSISETRDISVLNLSYYCLACLPVLLLKKSKVFSSIVIIAGLFVSLFALKRGAIITAFVMVLVYYWAQSHIMSNKVKSWGKILTLCVISVILFFAIDDYTNGALLTRFGVNEMVSGSGRSNILAKAVAALQNRSFIELLIGSGSGSTVSVLGTTAHNDIFEVLVDFGFIGLIGYFIIIVNILQRTLETRKSKSEYYPIYAMIFVYTVGLALFEGVIFNFSFLYIIIQISVLDYLKRRKNNVK